MTKRVKDWAKREPVCAYAAFLATLTFGIVTIHLVGGDPAPLVDAGVRLVAGAAGASPSSTSAPALPPGCGVLVVAVDGHLACSTPGE